MRHRIAGVKLNRNSAHRKALARNLMRGLIDQFDKRGYIITTREKAKFCQSKAEKLITLSRNKNVHNVRRAMAILRDRELVSKLFDDIGPYYATRPGGYTRVVRLSKNRLGDNATRAYLGFVRDESADESSAEKETTDEAQEE